MEMLPKLNTKLIITFLILLSLVNISLYGIKKMVNPEDVQIYFTYVVTNDTKESFENFQDMVATYDVENISFRYVSPKSADYASVVSKYNVTGSGSFIIGTKDYSLEKFGTIPNQEELKGLIEKYGK